MEAQRRGFALENFMFTNLEVTIRFVLLVKMLLRMLVNAAVRVGGMLPPSNKQVRSVFKVLVYTTLVCKVIYS